MLASRQPAWTALVNLPMSLAARLLYGTSSMTINVGGPQSLLTSKLAVLGCLMRYS